MANLGKRRLIVDRRQDFRTTADFPDGWINETLECGHVHIEPILLYYPATRIGKDDNRELPRHSDNAKYRICKECK